MLFLPAPSLSFALFASAFILCMLLFELRLALFTVYSEPSALEDPPAPPEICSHDMGVLTPPLPVSLRSLTALGITAVSLVWFGASDVSLFCQR